MTDETLEAAILTLRAQALNALGMMKDLARRPTEVDAVEKLALHATRLAQLEGAMLTLQQYAPTVKAAGIEALREVNDSAAAEQPTSVEVEEAEEDAPEQDTPEPSSISDEQLSKRSSTYRRSTGTSAEEANVIKSEKK